MANIRVKDLPNTNAANDNDEFIVDSSTSGTRRISYSELKSEISTDFAADVATYGIATLDSDNKLTASQIPDSLAQGMNFVGVANSASDLTSTTQGDFYVIQTAFGSYNVGDQAVYDGSAYVRVVDGTKEISEGGTGATTLDAAKTNLEIINVGTGPSQVPLNQHLGSLAYQSSDGVSMVNAEVETLEVTDKVTGTLDVEQSSGTLTTPSSVTTLRVNNSGSASNSAAVAVTSGASGSSFVLLGDNENDDIGYIKYSNQYNQLQFATAATDRVTIDSSGNVGIGKTPGTKLDVMQTGDSVKADFTNNVNANFRIKTSGANTQIGPSTASNLELQTQNITRWTVHSSNGNLIASSGVGIDFGSTNTTAGVTVTGSTLDHYEEGTWTPTTNGDATGVIGASSATYTRIGNIVTIRAVFTVTTNFTSNKIGGLPYQPADNSISSYTGATLAMNVNTSSSPVVAYVLGSNDTVHFSSGTNIGSAHAPNTTNASYRVSLSYNV